MNIINTNNLNELNSKAAYIKDNPIYEDSQLIKKIETKQIGQEWIDRIKDKFWCTKYTGVISDTQREMLKLRDKLLSFGGSEVSMPSIEDDLTPLLLRGQLWYGDRLKKLKGKPCQCHRNASSLWRANKDQLVLATGYYLQNDGMWRQHSFCVQIRPRKNRILETTVPAVAYYGYVMTEDEAVRFYWDCY